MFACELLLSVVKPPHPVPPVLRLEVDERVVPAVNLTFCLASGVSFGFICLFELHYVSIADDFVVIDAVNALVADLKKLLLGHLVPLTKVPTP